MSARTGTGRAAHLAVKAAGRQIGSSTPAGSMCGDSADGVCTGNMLSWMRGFSLESPIH